MKCGLVGTVNPWHKASYRARPRGNSLLSSARPCAAISIQAREASTGTLLWKQSVRGTERMMVSGSMLYLSDESYNLFAVKTSTGQLLWERIQCVDFSDIIAAEPHTRNGTLV